MSWRDSLPENRKRIQRKKRIKYSKKIFVGFLGILIVFIVAYFIYANIYYTDKEKHSDNPPQTNTAQSEKKTEEGEVKAKESEQQIVPDNAEEPFTENKAIVNRVVDGDTIEVTFNGAVERVRLIGVDTPESVHPDQEKNVPYGKIATQFTESALLGKTVFLEFDVEERDRYGRLLVYVHVDGKMFNLTLIEEGHAMVATYPPNVKYVDIFTVAQEKARNEKRGLWGIDSTL